MTVFAPLFAPAAVRDVGESASAVLDAFAQELSLAAPVPEEERSA